MKDLDIDVVPELDVPVRPEGVVEVAGVDAAVREPGGLYEELGDGVGAGHYDGADPAPGSGELDTLRLQSYTYIQDSVKITLFQGSVTRLISKFDI